MALAVQFLGGVIALIGAIGLMFGLDALPTERGMAWTGASATAIAGGAITFAIGVAASRLEALAASLRRGPVAMPIEPTMSAVAPPPPVAEPPRPVIHAEPVVDIPPPPVVVAPPPVAPVAARPKFSLPSMTFGKAGVAAGAVAATAAAGLAASRDEAERAVAAALDDLTHPEPAPPVSAAAPAPAPAPEPVDPPIEVLTPVIDDVPPIADDAEQDNVVAGTHEATPEPQDKPLAGPAKDDPLAAFEQELDRLIPLRSLRGKKGRKEAKADPAPVEAVEPAEPVAAAEPESVAVEPLPVAAEPAATADPVPETPAPDSHVADLPAPEPAPAPEVVGAYESGGAKYTMYSDGSVVAEAEGQVLYFKSLEDLREFIDGGVKTA